MNKKRNILFLNTIFFSFILPSCDILDTVYNGFREIPPDLVVSFSASSGVKISDIRKGEQELYNLAPGVKSDEKKAITEPVEAVLDGEGTNWKGWFLVVTDSNGNRKLNALDNYTDMIFPATSYAEFTFGGAFEYLEDKHISLMACSSFAKLIFSNDADDFFRVDYIFQNGEITIKAEEKEGYIFDGWYFGSKDGAQVSCKTLIQDETYRWGIKLSGSDLSSLTISENNELVGTQEIFEFCAHYAIDPDYHADN